MRLLDGIGRRTGQGIGRGRWTALAASVALLGGLLAWAPSAYAVEWLPAVTAAGQEFDPRSVQVLTRADGGQVVAWTTHLPTRAGHVAIRTPGSATFTHVASFRDAVDLVVAAGPDGSVMALWLDRPAGATVDSMRAARLAPGATSFDARLAFGPAGSARSLIPPVIDADGLVTAAWVRPTQTDSGTVGPVVSATYAPGDPRWSDPMVVGPGGAYALNLAMAIDADGDVTTAFNVVTNNRYGVWAATKVAGGRFSEPEDVSAPGGNAYFPTVAAGGDVTVVSWSGEDALVQAVRRSSDGTFGSVEDVAETAAGGATDVAVDRTGRATVVWTDRAPKAGVWAASAPAGSPFGGLERLTDAVASGARPVVTVGPDEAATVAWTQGSRLGFEIRAAHRTGARGFAPAMVVSDPTPGFESYYPALAVDGQGDVTLAWLSYDTAAVVNEMQTRVLDVTAPAITSATVPASAVPGSAVAMTVTATDRWGAPLSWTWDFGDGTTGTGSATSHTYPVGSYTVRVTATDAAGNASTVTRSITVAAAPANVTARDATAPRLSDARLTPRRLPTGHGARLTITSSEPARLAGVVQRKRDGHWRTVGTKRWSVQAGGNTRLFYGKTAQRRLRTGTYRALLAATDVAGNASATATLRFRVDRDG